jgi:hypothetical protein
MDRPVVLAAGRIIDGKGSLDAVDTCVEKIRALSMNVRELIIEPLSAGWHTPVPAGHFRSGCSPVTALAWAKELIESSLSGAVLIHGKDNLKTDYTKEQRRDLMNIYPDDFSLPEGYTRLAFEFMKVFGINENDFRELAGMLFENYLGTFRKNGNEISETPKWGEPLTSLFRMCDCANPNIDFEGKILLGGRKCAELLSQENPVYLTGTGLGSTEGDGRDYIHEIAEFRHLKNAYIHACSQAQVDFKKLFLEKQAYLEVYTCYPVIPMAFLFTSGIAESVNGLKKILTTHEVTVTGGMNLARAPWDNPALNAFITAFEKIRSGPVKTACIHGNGGLGYRQGVAIIQGS